MTDPIPDPSANADRRVLVVGASLGGVAVAEALRAGGHTGPITLVGSEPHLPYDRPPLSKHMLTSTAEPELDSILLKPAAWFAEHDIRTILGAAAVHLDGAGRAVTLDSGAVLDAEEVVIATGSRPRALPGAAGELDEVFTLRGWDDFLRFADRLRRPGHLAVVGAGFIGMEAISAAVELGWRVTVLERDEAVLSRVLPPAVATHCWAPFQELGVNLCLGSSVISIQQSPDQSLILATSHGDLSCDAVLLAAGGVPNIEWLEGAGIEVANGIVCDDVGRTSVSHVWAVGDVAAWDNGWTGRRERSQQWQAAREQATVCAQTLLGTSAKGWAAPPYFWSDLPFGRMQFWGEAGPDMTVHSFGAGNKRLSLLERDGLLRGVCTIKAPRLGVQACGMLDTQTSIDAALEWASNSLPAVNS